MPSRSQRGPLLVAAVVTAVILAVVVGGRLVAGSGEGTARADADEPEWTREVDGWPYSIVADDRRAVVVADVVSALDPDGDVEWASDVPGAGLHRPALSDATVLVSGDDHFAALDAETGAERWTVGAVDAGPVALATDGDGGEVALLATEGGALAAADAATGAERWTMQHTGELWAPPAVDPDAGRVAAVWSGFDAPRLRVVDLDRGDVEWEVAVDPYVAAPVIAGDAVVVAQGDGNFSGRAVAYDVADGTERWAAPLPASFQPGTVPAADGGEVAVIDRLGTVTMLDATTGDIRWFTELGRPVLHTRVILTPDAVVVTDEPGEVVVLDRADGRIRRRRRPDGFPVGVADTGARLLVALRLTQPGRVEAWPRP